jgi:integrase
MNREISEFLSFLKHERNASPHTLAAYERDLRQVAAYLKEREVRWDKAGNVLLRGFLAELHEKKRKKSTVGRKLAALRSFYDFCVRKKWISENPAKVLATPKQDKKIPSFLSEDEAAALLDLPKTAGPLDLRDKAILELFYATGIRVSELVGVETGDIHIGERLVRVRGKGKKERIVPFGRKAQGALEAAPAGRQGRGRGGRLPELPRRPADDAFGRADGPQVHPADGRGPEDQPPLPPPLLRDAPPRPGRGPARHPGAPRPLEPGHDPEIHARRPQAAPRSLQKEPPSVLKNPSISRFVHLQNPGNPSPRLCSGYRL